MLVLVLQTVSGTNLECQARGYILQNTVPFCSLCLVLIVIQLIRELIDVKKPSESTKLPMCRKIGAYLGD